MGRPCGAGNSTYTWDRAKCQIWEDWGEERARKLGIKWSGDKHAFHYEAVCTGRKWAWKFRLGQYKSFQQMCSKCKWDCWHFDFANPSSKALLPSISQAVPEATQEVWSQRVQVRMRNMSTNFMHAIFQIILKNVFFLNLVKRQLEPKARNSLQEQVQAKPQTTPIK